MKKVLIILALILTLSAACLAFTACGEEDGISFKTFEVNGTNVYGRVPNDQTTFNFANEVEVSENAEYVVSLDISGIQTAMTKTVSLEIGDNIFYVIETIDDEVTTIYTIVIHRSDVFYEVSFNVEGATVETQYVENGYFANEPTCNTEIPLGYEFLGWNFDFTKPITESIVVNAEIEVREEMKNFEFTSTATTCEITGSKDKHVTEIIIPDCVTSIGDRSFKPCFRLTSVTIGNSVTSIGESAFYGCSSLANMTIGNSVTSIGNSAFYFCSSLANMTIGNSVTSIGDTAFIGCTSLTSVTIPDSVTSIGREAFAGCTSLTSVTIPDSVTSIGGGAFVGCTSLTSIIVDEDNEVYKSIVGNLYSKDGKTLIQYAAGKTNISFNIPDSVISIGYASFCDCANLRNVTIPDSVTSIGELAFYDCTSLRNVTIPDGITNIGLSVFAGCTSLASVTIPNSVKSIGERAFYDCTSLTSVTIPDSVTSICHFAFYGCDSLARVIIPNNVTTIDWCAFYDCDGLTIYCEATSQPSGWHSGWNCFKTDLGSESSYYPVVWGHKS